MLSWDDIAFCTFCQYDRGTCYGSCLLCISNLDHYRKSYCSWNTTHYLRLYCHTTESIQRFPKNDQNLPISIQNLRKSSLLHLLYLNFLLHNRPINIHSMGLRSLYFRFGKFPRPSKPKITTLPTSTSILIFLAR